MWNNLVSVRRLLELIEKRVANIISLRELYRTLSLFVFWVCFDYEKAKLERLASVWFVLCFAVCGLRGVAWRCLALSCVVWRGGKDLRTGCLLSSRTT